MKFVKNDSINLIEKHVCFSKCNYSIKWWDVEWGLQCDVLLGKQQIVLINLS